MNEDSKRDVNNNPDEAQSGGHSPHTGVWHHADRCTVVLLCTDLMFGVRLQNMARAAGLNYVMARPSASLPAGDLLVVDLSARGDWESAIRQAAGKGMPVVAFGPHMDAEARRRARQAGAGRVLTNSNLVRDLPPILQTLSSSSTLSAYRQKMED